MTARILVCDDISEVGLEPLRRAGFEVWNRRGIALEDIPEVGAGAHAILVRSRTRVGGELLDRLPSVRVVGRAGFGLDTIDVSAATQRGVVVMHSPDGNVVTAAEFTVAMLFALARHIPQADASLRAGRWDKRRYRGVELAGKTLGVIGLGRVGRGVAERAAGLSMRVLGYDPAVLQEEVEGCGARRVSWDDVLSESDFLTVHVTASARTRGLVGDAAFERMKDGVRIINCARGGIVDEAALVRAVRTGKVAGAAVDVFESEPPTGSPLLTMPQVIVTPHLVASTFESQINVARALSEQVRDFLITGALRGAVNPAAAERRAAQAG